MKKICKSVLKKKKKLKENFSLAQGFPPGQHRCPPKHRPTSLPAHPLHPLETHCGRFPVQCPLWTVRTFDFVYPTRKPVQSLLAYNMATW